ncbi:ankyrin repeat domain-containing protein, partial [bacterium]|nr:ankyrin repeat domain-containing protein [bacterium]
MRKVMVIVVLAVILINCISAQEIFEAVKTNDLAKIKVLTGNDPGLVSAKDELGNTPLHTSAIAGSVPITEFLLSRVADINARTNDGRSAYNIAEAAGNGEVMELFKSLGADTGPQQFPVITGPYLGQIPPGKEMKRFAPGIVYL